jgi:outer membrane immunogenic protein
MALRNKTLACTFGAAIIACSFATSAQADGYSAPRGYAPAPSSWTGFYIGAHGGGAWLVEDGRYDGLVNGVVNPAGWNLSSERFGLGASSGVVGLHVGYNAQVSPHFLVGVEWDWSFTDLKDTQTVFERNAAGVATTTPAFMSTEVNSLTSVRGRLGFVSSGVLVYATGGFAAGDVRLRSHISSVPAGTNWDIDTTKFRTGFVVGGGAEYKLSRNLLLRAEYLYYNLAESTYVADGAPPLPPFQIRYHWDPLEVHVARVGLTYRFDADRAVPLK